MFAAGANVNLRFYDFFAGAGLATLGLSRSWRCVWANDIAAPKAAVYTANFGNGHFTLGDVAQVAAHQLPIPAEMAWASFPCQDLSLAGWRKGLAAERSGVFWAFWRIMHELAVRRERPPIIVIENVAGLLYGDSFTGLCEAIASLGMQFGALVIDAKRFVPQSRPRVFLVAVDDMINCSALSADQPVLTWTPGALVRAQEQLPGDVKARWRWWRLPVPKPAHGSVGDVIEDAPALVDWHTHQQTQALLDMMSDTNRKKIEKALRLRKRQVGFLYKRIRQGRQRAEVRFDGISGCLRTPQGGSSRQTVVIIENGKIRTRLLSPREAARLMGVPDSFKLPAKYNDAYKAMGDGVVVPVVSWLSEYLLRPIAELLTCPRESEGADAVPTGDLSCYRASTERRATQWLTSQRQKSAPLQQS
ncbi:MAG: DNA cytosine methyltransferase [Bryobacterales bacterium]|nr:DNA cytosine methyltransferase [Bryobacterales bacterium]